MDDVTVTYDQGDNIGNIQLKRMDILTINEHCRAHIPQVVLTSNRYLKSTHSVSRLHSARRHIHQFKTPSSKQC